MTNRDEFLRKQLQTYCSDEQIRIAIEDRPASSSIPTQLIDKLADAVIRNQRTEGIGNLICDWSTWWMVDGGNDCRQIWFRSIRQGLTMAQELAYLYGWPDMRDEDGSVDEETKYVLTILMGAMLGSDGGASTPY